MEGWLLVNASNGASWFKPNDSQQGQHGAATKGTMKMLRHLWISMSVECSTADVLTKLQENREQHAKLVAEARLGYVKTARVELEKRLGQLVEGKVVSVVFALHVPRDYTAVYDTAISMLQMHKPATITLAADEFRHLMDDVWDWSEEFAAINSAYSPSTRAYTSSKGIGSD